MLTTCGLVGIKNVSAADPQASLRDTLQAIINESPGEIGLALIAENGDTLTIGNYDRYPLMSVFKLHQAIALCRHAGETGMSIDSMVSIPRASLNPDTWSPMLKEHSEAELRLSLADLMRYTLMQSDNNASNYLFERILPVAATDSIIASIAGRDGFRLAYTEADMFADHSRAYANHSSPLAAARLLRLLITDSIVSPRHKAFLTKALSECKTGADRIVAPLAGESGVVVYHKTGSGFRSADGLLAAQNDVAHILLPDGRSYTLAILIKDTPQSADAASAVIARLSAALRPAK